jgi:hypothetical protein
MIHTFTNAPSGMAATNYYDDLCLRLTGGGVPLPVAVERVATAYLDGKPLPVGKKKLSKKERDSLFWSSDVAKDCPPDAWITEAMSLALARYLGQEPVAAEGLVTRVARVAPDALIRAVRYSALVLRSHFPRRAELDQAASETEAVAELCRVLDLFALAHRDRVAAVETQRARLAELSVFDLLIYASLYAFEVLVPRDFKVKALAPPSRVDLELAWDALSDLLAWKLAGASISSLKLTDDSIGRSVARHLRPILFESGTASSNEAVKNLRALHALMDAQIELNESPPGRRMRSATTTAFDSSGGAIGSRSSRWIQPHGLRGRTMGGSLSDCMTTGSTAQWTHTSSRSPPTRPNGRSADRRMRTPIVWRGYGRCKRSFACVRRTVSPTKSLPVPETPSISSERCCRST